MLSRRGFRRYEEWSRWAMVTGLGWVIAMVFTLTLYFYLSRILPPVLALIPALYAGGVAVTVSQTTILRRGTRRSNWLWVGGLGWGLAILAATPMLRFLGPVFGWVAGGLVGGLVFGWSQSYGLWQRERLLFEWTGLTILGWILAFAIGSTLARDLGVETSQLGPVEVAAAASLGWGFISLLGFALYLLVFSAFSRGESDLTSGWRD